jgi:hypothetical protein
MCIAHRLGQKKIFPVKENISGRSTGIARGSAGESQKKIRNKNSPRPGAKRRAGVYPCGQTMRNLRMVWPLK